MRTFNKITHLTRAGRIIAAGLSLVGCSAYATITINVVGTQLTITSDGADFIVIGAADSNSQVSVSDGFANINAGQVTALTVQGGPGDQQITLQSVNQSNFPLLTSVTINGGGGADQIFGSGLNDTIIDPDGGDDLQGETGANVYNVVVTGSNPNTNILSGLGSLHITSTVPLTYSVTSSVDNKRKVTAGTQVVDFSIASVSSVSISASDGADTFNLVGLTSAVLNVDGGDGSDTAVVDAEGNNATQTDSSVSVTSKQIINFTSVETISVINAPNISGGNGNSNGGSNTNTNGNGGNGNSNGSTGNNNGGGGGNGNANGGGGGGNNNANGAVGNGNGDIDGDGDPNNDPNDPPVNNNNADCGAGICGAGMMSMLPLMIAGLAAIKFARRKR